MELWSNYYSMDMSVLVDFKLTMCIIIITIFKEQPIYSYNQCYMTQVSHLCYSSCKQLFPHQALRFPILNLKIFFKNLVMSWETGKHKLFYPGGKYISHSYSHSLSCNLLSFKLQPALVSRYCEVIYNKNN